MNRDRARRILGLPEPATGHELLRAHRALRAHVEDRERSAPSDAARELREAELDELDAARDLLQGPPKQAGSTPLRRLGWVELWALAATGLALALAIALILQSGRPGSQRVALVVPEGAPPATPTSDEAGPAPAMEVTSGEPDPGAAVGEAAASSPRTELVAEANMPTASLTIHSAQSDAIVARGPADSRSYWLEEGFYEIEVTHPACPDTWNRAIRAHGREPIVVEPEVCTKTGWLRVTSNVEGARVQVDGESAGLVGGEPRTLGVGEHRVEVSHNGREPWQGVAAIEPASKLELHVELPSDEEEERDELEEAFEKARKHRDTEGWHDRVTQWLLAHYDTDDSGLLDRKEEIEEIPCEEWLGLEASLTRGGLKLPLTQLYGLGGPSESWVENALGISYGMRQHAHVRMRECGLE